MNISDKKCNKMVKEINKEEGRNKREREKKEVLKRR